jgi:hypothetical protein
LCSVYAFCAAGHGDRCAVISAPSDRADLAPVLSGGSDSDTTTKEAAAPAAATAPSSPPPAPPPAAVVATTPLPVPTSTATAEASPTDSKTPYVTQQCPHFALHCFYFSCIMRASLPLRARGCNLTTSRSLSLSVSHRLQMQSLRCPQLATDLSSWFLLVVL